MTFGSLFSGVGGIELGLERAGFECRWQIENDSYCNQVLAKRWPHVKRYGDICTVTGDELERVDLLAGGFPCQDLSQAGKRAGIEGTRSGLWFEFARIVGVVRPRYVLIENVPGLLVPGAMRRVVGELARLGYVGCWRSLRASDFGASHLRKRVFIVAHREGNGWNEGEAESAGIERGFDAHQRGGALAHAARELYDGRGHSGTNGWREPANADRALADAGNGFVPEPGRRSEGRDGSGSAGEVLLDHAERTRLEVGDGIREQPLRQDAEPLAPGLPARGPLGNSPTEGRSRWGEGDEYDTSSGGRSLYPSGAPLRFAPGPSDPRWPAILAARPDLAPALTPLCRMADGVPDWMDRAMSDRTRRLGRLGNAVVPDCAEWAGWRIREFEEIRCRN